ncbi:MAG: EF-P lysine aminoacylase GenX [Woeseiaceae bacterium]|nr:EF-P lysine aminoacylase GenX [Woeseiaceae bacterium]NIP22064.1 EF-P lysine aminoacylase GenX [Woeseiaceae bacterium]NIS91178.1 EF-P lysine aminoacylase GenX [Woeseiaceae bacterium]
MSNWKPLSDTSVAMRRAALIERARQYFSDQGLLAVDTPALGRYAISDPNIESLRVRAKPGKDSFLQTSPEFYMKRLLASGYPDIYSISRVFRDGESGRRHLPEFTMAEWYRLGFGLDAIVEDCTNFIAACLGMATPDDSIVRLDYYDAIARYADIDALAAETGDLVSRATEDSRLQQELAGDRNAALDLIMSTIVAPGLAPDRLTVIQHYPADQAALARLCPQDEQVADRFEVFCGDLELANGYVELTDANEQRRRVERDIAAREQSGKSSLPVDETLIAALEAGLPECAGVSVGIERLHMVLDHAEDIRDVITFATETS